MTKISKISDLTDIEFTKLVENSESYRQIALKAGYSDSGSQVKKLIEERIKLLNLDTSHFLKHSGGANKIPDEEVFKLNSSVGQSTLRRRYLSKNYTEYRCAICGMLPIWQGKELVLTLDHIDGNHHNNVISNLRWICPNCDRQLDTYGGRNKI